MVDNSDAIRSIVNLAQHRSVTAETAMVLRAAPGPDQHRAGRDDLQSR